MPKRVISPLCLVSDPLGWPYHQSWCSLPQLCLLKARWRGSRFGNSIPSVRSNVSRGLARGWDASPVPPERGVPGLPLATSIIIDQPTRNAPRMPHSPRPPVMLWVALMFSVGAWAGIVIVALKLLG